MIIKCVLKRVCGAFLTCIMLANIFTPLAEAKNVKHEGKQIKHEQKAKAKKQKDCGDIIIDVLKCSKYDFDKARREKMSLEDYIITSYIAQQAGDDFLNIFRMQKNGKPYKDICKALGINWGSVRRHVKNSHDAMSEDAVKAGLVMWGLHEILH